VVHHFQKLNETRRKTALKDRLYVELFNSIFWNVVNLGTGAILILSAEAMRSGRFTVGDFALFTFYLGFVADFVRQTGALAAQTRQGTVSATAWCSCCKARHPTRSSSMGQSTCRVSYRPYRSFGKPPITASTPSR
jgi:ABC-type multidrug transport system fused ATPase/permease subunit